MEVIFKLVNAKVTRLKMKKTYSNPVRAEIRILISCDSARFRIDAKEYAELLGLVGFMKTEISNDGIIIHIIVEGRRQMIECILNSLNYICIKEIDIRFGNYTGEFTSFDIMY